MLSHNKPVEKISKNYNIDVIQRILNALYEMGKSRITDTAVHAGLNHYTIKRYLHLMNTLHWIGIEKEEDHLVIYLTETGIFVHNQLCDLVQDDKIPHD
jgi:predicted transcriptional regulator